MLICTLATQGLADTAHIMAIHDEWHKVTCAEDFPLEAVEDDLHEILHNIEDTSTIFGLDSIENCQRLADACATERQRVEEIALIRSMEATSLLPADHWDAETATRAAERPSLQSMCKHRATFKAHFGYRAGENRICDRCEEEGVAYLVHCRRCQLRVCEECRGNVS